MYTAQPITLCTHYTCAGIIIWHVAYKQVPALKWKHSLKCIFGKNSHIFFCKKNDTNLLRTYGEKYIEKSRHEKNFSFCSKTVFRSGLLKPLSAHINPIIEQKTAGEKADATLIFKNSQACLLSMRLYFFVSHLWFVFFSLCILYIRVDKKVESTFSCLHVTYSIISYIWRVCKSHSL